VFAYSREPGVSADISITPEELGFQGSVYVYNPMTRTGLFVDYRRRTTPPRGNGARLTLGAEGEFRDRVDENGSYYVVVPVGSSGIAFLGDAGKWVSVGNARVSRRTDQGGILSAEIVFARGETQVVLQGFSKTPLGNVSAAKGILGTFSYDPPSGRFQIQISPDSDGKAVVVLNALTPAVADIVTPKPTLRRAA
jgi:hypothetical protein